MSKIKLKKTILVSSIALALSACGGNSDSPGENNVEAYQLKNLPVQRSIDIPKSLLTKKTDSNVRALNGSVVMMPVESDGGIGDGAGPIPLGSDGQGQGVSFGYLMIKDSAFSVERSRLEQEREVLMLDAVWDDIKSRCDGTALGEACSIPKNKISLKVTEALVKANDEINRRIDDLYDNQYGDIYGGALYGPDLVSSGSSGVSTAAVDPQTVPEPHLVDDGSQGDYQVMPEPQGEDYPVVGEPQPDFVVGDVIPLGSISYTQYGADEEFQYEVEIEPTYMEPISTTMESVDGELVEFIGSVVESERFFVIWSSDEKRVKSGFRYEDDQSSYSYTFSYLDQGGEKIVTIRDESSFDMGEEFGKGGFLSTISLSEKESDPEGTVNISFDKNDFMPEFTMKMSSKGRASDSGGFLRTESLFTSALVEEETEEKKEFVFNTEEIFDGKGNMLKYRWCDTACDQEENWNEGVSDMTLLPMPMDEPITDFTFEENEFYMDDDELELIENSFFEVAITVSGLVNEGEYIIVSEAISGNEIHEVFDNMIGGGMVDGENSNFHYWGEESQLDTAMVYLIAFEEGSSTFQYEEITEAEIMVVGYSSEPSVMMPVEPDNGIGDGAGPIPVMDDSSNSETPMVLPNMM